MATQIIHGRFVPADTADATDRLFGLLPVVITFDLPFPPSINRLWRRGATRGLYRSKEYKDWQQSADMLAIAQHATKQPTITGRFQAYVRLARKRRGDLDNYGAKAVFDWCQSRGIIADDGNCERLIMEWVDPDMAPHGARISMWSL